jgi:pyruvate/2-oxoglutarate dehydrogenase complex dihydrolipoamide acyltransferase (E2) component
MNKETHVVHMPVFDPNDRVAVITRIISPSGERVEKESVLFLVESAKGQWEITAPVSGWVEFSLEEGDRLATGSQIAVIHPSPTSRNKTDDVKPTTKSHITRKAAKLMRDMKISIHELSSLTSITEADVRAYASRQDQNIKPLPQTVVKEAEVRKLERSGNNQFLSSVTMNFLVAEVEKQLTTASGGAFFSGPAEYICYRASLLLPKFPSLNGFFDSGKAFTYREVSLGYAMNLNHLGLKVVTLRNPSGNYRDFCLKLSELTYAYLKNSLGSQDLLGATFNISNMYNFEIDQFLPLLSEGQSGILGIASPDLDGNFKVTLSFDHRMLDAVEADGFLKLLKAGAE